jgi:hypothetical protein
VAGLRGIPSLPPVSKVLQNLASNPAVVQAIDQVAAKFHLHDDALDGLLAELGLE